MPLLLGEGSYIDNVIFLSIRKHALEANVLLKVRIVAEHDFAHLAVLTGAEAHAIFVTCQRTHLGADTEVLINAEALVDPAREVRSLLQLHSRHAGTGVE